VLSSLLEEMAPLMRGLLLLSRFVCTRGDCASLPAGSLDQWLCEFSFTIPEVSLPDQGLDLKDISCSQIQIKSLSSTVGSPPSLTIDADDLSLNCSVAELSIKKGIIRGSGSAELGIGVPLKLGLDMVMNGDNLTAEDPRRQDESAKAGGGGAQQQIVW